jgi:hypothetical protein
MKRCKFEKGVKFRRPGWASDSYYEYWDESGQLVSKDGNTLIARLEDEEAEDYYVLPTKDLLYKKFEDLRMSIRSHFPAGHPKSALEERLAEILAITKELLQ